MSNPTIVRYPQGLTADVLALENNYGKYGSIIRDLLIYINKAGNTDLFGFVQLDITKFALEMGYSKGHLTTPISDSTVDSKSITHYDHTWDSYFEYALLLMNQKVFSWKNSTKDGYTLNSLVLVDTLKVTYANKKNAKRTYEVRIGTYAFDSFFKEYYHINFCDYKKIADSISTNKNRNVLTNLYLYLIRAYNITKNKNGKDTFFNSTVDEISDILQLKYKEGNHPERKRLVKEALTKLESLEKLRFKYTFRKSNTKSRFEYLILIEFFEDSENNVIETKWGTFALYYMNELKVQYYQLKEGRKVNYNEPTKQQFIEWFNEKQTDTLEKIECIKSVLNTIYRFEVCFSLTKYFRDDTLTNMYLKFSTKEFFNRIDNHLSLQKEVTYLGDRKSR